MKQSRNTLATYRQLKSDDGVIDWKYLQNLQNGLFAIIQIIIWYMYLCTIILYIIFNLFYDNLFLLNDMLASVAQEKISLNLANKLSATHMEWKKIS